MKRTVLITSLITASLTLAACGTMGDRDGGSRGHRGHGDFKAMRQAAIAACQGKAEGTQVSITDPQGKVISGVCVKTPQGELHAMPEAMLARMQAAKQACAGKSAGDTVQITDFKDASKTIDATCSVHGDNLVAHPKHMKKDGWNKDRPDVNNKFN
jgi:hypothetical protein